MSLIVLETERLRLRAWTEGDIAPFMEALNTPVVMRWLGGVQSEAQFRDAYERIQGYDRDFGHTFWLVERKEDDALLGFCGLKRVNSAGALNPGDFEIGWRFAEFAQGQGYAFEAAQHCLDAAFTRFAAPHVVALTVIGNAPSWRLMEKLGMERRIDLDFTGGFSGEGDESIIVYSITRTHWQDPQTS